MKVKLLSLLKVIRASALIGLSLISNYGTAQINVTVDTTIPADQWKGYMFVNNLDGSNAFNQVWAVSDIKTEFDTSNNQIILYPNYNTYNATDAYWSNGELGNKIMDGITYIETDDLNGIDFTFSGNVISNTIASGYTAVAFVKVFNADNTVTYANLSTPLTTGNFTIYCNGSDYPDAAQVQYGYTVTGLNGNPANMATNGNIIVGAAMPVAPTETTVSINTNSNLIAYANWYQLDGTTYVNGSEWSVADIKTVRNETSNTLDLHPNFSAYTDEVTNRPNESVFHNGEIGNSVFEGNTYVQDDALAGQTFIYTGNTVSNSLVEGYRAIAFIKIFDANYGNLQMTTAPLVAGENFNITASPAAGSHVQYGYAVIGLNANPTQEAALGFARVGQAVASVKTQVQNKVTLYPNPTSSILNISSNEIIESIQIVNMLGQTVIVTSPKGLTEAVSVNSLTNGIYVINTVTNGRTNSARFVKQ